MASASTALTADPRLGLRDRGPALDDEVVDVEHGSRIAPRRRDVTALTAGVSAPDEWANPQVQLRGVDGGAFVAEAGASGPATDAVAGPRGLDTGFRVNVHELGGPAPAPPSCRYAVEREPGSSGALRRCRYTSNPYGHDAPRRSPGAVVVPWTNAPITT